MRVCGSRWFVRGPAELSSPYAAGRALWQTPCICVSDGRRSPGPSESAPFRIGQAITLSDGPYCYAYIDRRNSARRGGRR